MKSDCSEQNRSLDSLVGVKQVPPRLTAAFKSTTTVDVDVLAAEQEEASCVLEIKFECVLLPEVGIVCECDAALDVHIDVRQVA